MSTNSPGSWIAIDKLKPGVDYIISNNGAAVDVGSPSGHYKQLYAGAGPSTTTAPPPDPNNMPDMSMSLEMAHGMWAAKWGWDWIPATALQDADGLNWYRLAHRLLRMTLVETYPATDAYKLVPKTWT